MSLVTYNSTNGQKTILGDGKIRFNIDNTQHLSIYVTNWKNTTDKGVNFYSDKNNKYTCFGYDDTAENDWHPSLVLNHGLNPGGRTEKIIMYGDSYFSNNMRLKGKVLFGDSDNGFWYTSDTNEPYTIGKFGVNGVSYSNYEFGVHGSAYISNNLTVNGLTESVNGFTVGGKNVTVSSDNRVQNFHWYDHPTYGSCLGVIIDNATTVYFKPVNF